MIEGLVSQFWTHFNPLDHPKIRLGCGREINVWRSRMAISTYFRLLDQPKMRLGWSQKATFLVVATECELNFYLLNRQNVNWMNSKKWWFKLWMLLWRHFLLLDNPKMRLSSSRYRNDSYGRIALTIHFLPLDNPKLVLCRSRKRYFKWSPGTGNSFSSSWLAQNATSVKSRTRCFKGS